MALIIAGEGVWISGLEEAAAPPSGERAALVRFPRGRPGIKWMKLTSQELSWVFIAGVAVLIIFSTSFASEGLEASLTDCN